jgi:hypothetical protein
MISTRSKPGCGDVRIKTKLTTPEEGEWTSSSPFLARSAVGRTCAADITHNVRCTRQRSVYHAKISGKHILIPYEARHPWSRTYFKMLDAYCGDKSQERITRSGHTPTPPRPCGRNNSDSIITAAVG